MAAFVVTKVVPAFSVSLQRGPYYVRTGGAGLRGLAGSAGGITGVGVSSIVRITQAAYNALTPPDPSIVYLIY
jgi:hypothetical protein